MILSLDDASKFTLRVECKRPTSCKKLLATFAKQHATRCPDAPRLDASACALRPPVAADDAVPAGA